MLEMSCHKTRYHVMIALNRPRLVEERHSDLIAALLKAIAQYTDGPPAVAVAYEEDLPRPPGMRFTFANRSSRDLFWRRVSQCLDHVTFDALVISPLEAVAVITQATLPAQVAEHPRDFSSLGLGVGA